MVVQRLLRAARDHLGMDVAFVGQLIDGERVLRWVDQVDGLRVLAQGSSDPADESFCHLIAQGRLPQLLRDAGQHPVSAAMAATAAVPVGSHVSVPIRFSDGRLYGTFCCFSLDVHADLDERHLAAVEALASIAADYIEALEGRREAMRARRRHIVEVIDAPAAVVMVFQPLWNVATSQVVGVEALARFPGSPHGPEWFFAEAGGHGLSTELETKAVRLALDRLPEIPAPLCMNVNVSPEALADPRMLDELADVPPHRLVVEVTEHSAIEDYSELNRVTHRLAELGIRLSIDDVGMGWSGLNRILECSPHQLKLDERVVRGVHRDPVRQALIESFCAFARRADIEVVAEGIELREELVTLRELGMDTGQGYLLGRPGPLADCLLAADGIIDLLGDRD